MELHEYEELVIEALIEQGEMSRGDAQGVFEAIEYFTLENAWVKNTPAITFAQNILGIVQLKPITYEEAVQLVNMKSVYRMYEDGTEALVEKSELDKNHNYGVEQ